MMNMNTNEKTKIAFELVDCSTRKVIGYTNKEGLEYFCSCIYTGARGLPGNAFGINGIMLYVRSQVEVPSNTKILYHRVKPVDLRS